MPPEELGLKGKKGTAEVTWRMTPEGKVCITSFNGVSLGEGPMEMAADDENMEGEGGEDEGMA